MTPWWKGRMCGLDLETTGVDVEEARIVSAGVVLAGGGLPVEHWTWLIKPDGWEISEEATAVHGITNEYAAEHGVDWQTAVEEIADKVGIYRINDVPLVAFNAPFDLTIVDREIRRIGRGWGLDHYVYSQMFVVDPLCIDRHLDRYRPKRVASHSLEDCCRLYDATVERPEGTHGAAADALAACRVAFRIGQRGDVVRRVRDADSGREKARLKREWESVRNDLPALHAAQARWYAEKAIDYEAYLRRGDVGKGTPPDPDAVISRDWPIVPLPATVQTP